MTSEIDAPDWPDDPRRLELSDLAELSGLSEQEVLELVDYGALTPVDESARPQVFSVRAIAIARTAYRLRRDFELEPHGVSLLLAYLDRIRDLEAELCALRARLPR